MDKFDCILFDLDGTLIDTTPLIMASFRHTFLYHFNEEAGEKELLKFLGIPLKKPFEELYPDSVEILMKTYREFNERHHDQYTGVFTGVIRTFEACRAAGVKLGVVTSKRRELALRGMRLFGLDAYLDVFVALEDTVIHKPQGEPVLKALEFLGRTEKRGVLYVGDSPYDILCAQNAGVASAAVGWSYLPHEELQALEPELFLERFEELLLYI